MDELEHALAEHFDPGQAPRQLALRWRSATPAGPLAAITRRVTLEASRLGIRRLAWDAAGPDRAEPGGRSHLERARAELAGYLAGERAFFGVPVDFSGLGEFQLAVLRATAAVPSGETRSYGELARAIGRPGAARAVGNALGANPVPLLVPCHRIIQAGGRWGRYALGAALKTALLEHERGVPALLGSDRSRVVCRHGCPHAARIALGHRIAFASVADARSVGYRPCRACRPERSVATVAIVAPLVPAAGHPRRRPSVSSAASQAVSSAASQAARLR